MNPPAGPVPPEPGGEGLRTVDRPPASSRAVSPTPLFLFGIPIHNVTTEETLDWIEARARSGRAAQVLTSNLDFIMQAWRDPEMQRIHLDADLVIADGWPPVFFSGWFGPRLKGRVAGSDLVVRLGPFARDRGLSVYALGGRDGVAAQAMRILGERSPGLRVAGCSSPPVAQLLDMDHAGTSAEIARANPHLLLVAFGAPKQDKWIRMNLHRMGAPVAMGIGASLDFVAGVQTRAPRWVQSLALEWFWRLCSQPRRLFKRYSSNMVFLATILVRLAFVRLCPGGRSAGPAAPEASVLLGKNATLVRFSALTTESEVEAFCAPLEAAARERTLVLDVSGFPWLSSLELGAIVRLAQASRSGGRRLLLSGVPDRSARLLRLLRADRWLEMPGSATEWDRCLDEYSKPADARRTRWVEAGEGLQAVLAEDFEGADAAAALVEVTRRASAGGVRSLVLDGSRLRYVDSSGLLFLKSAARLVPKAEGKGVRLRAFARPMLDVLRREGLGDLVDTSS
jgi:N-acetylglucosaminyldiphosphoundecaprenol N-acetyl-beta-D-mannosaminyltransferase